MINNKELNQMSKMELVKLGQHFNKISYIKGLGQMKKKDIILNMLMDEVTLKKAMSLYDLERNPKRQGVIDKIAKLNKKVLKAKVADKPAIFDEIAKLIKSTK